MPASRPTQYHAFSLRTISDGSEELLRFQSINSLARNLAINVASKTAKFKHDVQRELITSVIGFGHLLRISIRDRVIAKNGQLRNNLVLGERELCTFQAFSKRGSVLQITPILSLGRRLEEFQPTRRFLYRKNGFHHLYVGYGPVPGIRKHRGSRRYMREIGTMAERRSNALVLKEEFEVSPRSARLGRNLPDSWDDFLRHTERCWKCQHKGRKSWERQRHDNGWLAC